jgi:hypothetical protein
MKSALALLWWEEVLGNGLRRINLHGLDYLCGVAIVRSPNSGVAIVLDSLCFLLFPAFHQSWQRGVLLVQPYLFFCTTSLSIYFTVSAVLSDPKV